MKYNHDNARMREQAARMRDLEQRGVCAFCPEHLTSETTSKIELETENWIVKFNDYPYENTKLHLLIIPKAHAKTISDLSEAAKAEFLELVTKAEKHYMLTSYAIAMRSGDMRLNGGTVEHMHAHLIVGDTQKPNHQPVRFKMSSPGA